MENLAQYMFRIILSQNEKLTKVSYNITEDGSYGYYLSTDISVIYFILKRLQAKSMIDLGCGAGLLQSIISTYTSTYTEPKIKMFGIEREQSLITLAKRLPGQLEIENHDLLSITTKDLKDADVIYMYEPIANREKAQIFADNLVNIISKKQVILLKSSGYTLSHFKDSGKLEIVLNIYNFYLLKLKEI